MTRKSIRFHQGMLATLALLCLLLAGCSTAPKSSGGYAKKTPGVAAPAGTAGKSGSLPKAGSGRGGYYLDDGPMDE
ncbi:MAG: hypothetical protein LBM56_00460, partial [Burkholderiaceae bacterium]|nr:hypothetical protein [Burkholderiaceae bacterium]